MDRPKPFLHVHLRSAGDPESGGGSGRGPRRSDSAPKPGAFGRGFGFEFGPWLAISIEQMRSRSPCDVRTRDEKRTSPRIRTEDGGWGQEDMRCNSLRPPRRRNVKVGHARRRIPSPR